MSHYTWKHMIMGSFVWQLPKLQVWRKARIRFWQESKGSHDPSKFEHPAGSYENTQNVLDEFSKNISKYSQQ